MPFVWKSSAKIQQKNETHKFMSRFGKFSENIRKEYLELGYFLRKESETLLFRALRFIISRFAEIVAFEHVFPLLVREWHPWIDGFGFFIVAFVS